eukprot:2603779-Rhodomonas_salina.1
MSAVSLHAPYAMSAISLRAPYTISAISLWARYAISGRSWMWVWRSGAERRRMARTGAGRAAARGRTQTGEHPW